MKKYFLFTILISSLNTFSAVEIEDCASINSDIKRLACYDYLVTGISKPSNEIDVTEASTSEEKTEATANSRSSFGFSRRQMSQSNEKSPKNSLSSAINSISKTFGGKTRFKLTNNQLWETQSVVSSKLGSFKVKSEVRIEEANMGGFWMINKSSKVRIKVKRIS
jgi:hypothetical protein